MSGNGDILGYIRRTEFCTKIGGLGAQDCVQEWIGPTIQSNVTYPNRPNLYHRVIVQEGASASAYNLFNVIFGRDPGLDHTQIVLVSGHDGAQGRIELAADGRATVRWPGLKQHPYRQLATAEIHRFAAALGGEYQELAAFQGRVGTVHPLGGCSIASSPVYGVINSKGQVFDARLGGQLDPRTGTPQTHSGLYVVDAAAIPTALGVNPFLTISALAERFANTSHSNPPSPTSSPSSASTIGACRVNNRCLPPFVDTSPFVGGHIFPFQTIGGWHLLFFEEERQLFWAIYMRLFAQRLHGNDTCGTERSSKMR